MAVYGRGKHVLLQVVARNPCVGNKMANAAVGGVLDCGLDGGDLGIPGCDICFNEVDAER